MNISRILLVESLPAVPITGEIPARGREVFLFFCTVPCLLIAKFPVDILNADEYFAYIDGSGGVLLRVYANPVRVGIDAGSHSFSSSVICCPPFLSSSIVNACSI